MAYLARIVSDDLGFLVQLVGRVPREDCHEVLSI